MISLPTNVCGFELAEMLLASRAASLPSVSDIRPTRSLTLKLVSSSSSRLLLCVTKRASERAGERCR